MPAASLTGKEFETAIVVLPYKFLAKYHFDVMKTILKSLSTAVAISKFSPTEITEEELPEWYATPSAVTALTTSQVPMQKMLPW